MVQGPGTSGALHWTRSGVSRRSVVTGLAAGGMALTAGTAAREAQGPEQKSRSPLQVRSEIATQRGVPTPQVRPSPPVQRPVVPMQTPSVPPPPRIAPANGDNAPGPRGNEVQAENGEQPVPPTIDIAWGPNENQARSTVELGSSIESVFAEFNAPNGVFPIGDNIIYQWVSGKVEGTTEMAARAYNELLVKTDKNGIILDMSYKVLGQWAAPAAMVGIGL